MKNSNRDDDNANEIKPTISTNNYTLNVFVCKCVFELHLHFKTAFLYVQQ